MLASLIVPEQISLMDALLPRLEQGKKRRARARKGGERRKATSNRAFGGRTDPLRSADIVANVVEDGKK
jgi:hypothetical protein